MPHRRHQSQDAGDNPYFPSTSSIIMGKVRSAAATLTSDTPDDDPDTTAEIAGLLRETRLWRIANHAQWVAWGVVQAKVPELDADMSRQQSREKHGQASSEHHKHFDPSEGTDPLDAEAKANVEDLKNKRPEGHHLEETLETRTQNTSEDSEDDAASEEEFDYLSYARDRAMFFWGDCLQLGLVTEEKLEKWGIAEEVKVVPW